MFYKMCDRDEGALNRKYDQVYLDVVSRHSEAKFNAWMNFGTEQERRTFN